MKHGPFTRVICWILKHDHTLVHLRLLHDEGQVTLLGPMDRWTAEWMLANDIAHHPFHYKRRIISARIIA